MADVQTRRQQYADATRAALIDAATELFVEQGFATTTVGDVCQRARVTSGALYHHFDNKRDLFRVVFETVLLNTINRATTESITDEPNWTWVVEGLHAYLSSYQDLRYRVIIVQEGPSALGWADWREIDHRHSLPPLEGLLTALMDAGVLTPQPVGLVARVLCAAIAEAALAIGESDDPQAAQTGAAELLLSLCRGLQARPD